MTDIHKQRLYDYGPVILLLTAALLVRLYRFGAVPGGFNQDEAMAAYEAWSLALYGTDRFGMRWPVYFTAWGFAQMNVLMSYFMIPFFKWFGMSVTTARLPILITGMAGLYALYRFSKNVWGKNIAIAVLAFAAVSPWHFMQSRWALESNLFPSMLMLSVYWLHRGLHRERYLYLSMAAFALCMYAYGIAYFSVPLLLLVLGVFLLVKKVVTVRQILGCMAVYLLLAWPIFAVMLINYFRWPTLYTPWITVPFFSDSVRMNDLLVFSPNITQQLQRNLQALYQVLILQNDGLPWNTVTGYGTIYRWSLPLAVIGVIVCILPAGRKWLMPANRKNNISTFRTHEGLLIVFCWLGVALLSGLMVNEVNVNRVNIIFYPLLFFTGLGIYIVVAGPVHLLRLHMHKAGKWVSGLTPVAVMIVLLIYTGSFISFTRAYFGPHHRYLSYVFYDDFYQCLSQAEQLGFDRLYVTAYTQYRGAWNVSEILTLFGLRIDPSVLRQQDAYQHRYRYVTYDGIPVEEEDIRVCYIFNMAERSYFPEELFDITTYGNFGVAVNF